MTTSIQTHAQALKARSALTAMANRLAQLKAAGDKDAARDLAAQYSLLRDALQEYNEAEAARQAASTEDFERLQATVAQLKALLWERDVRIRELQEELAHVRKPTLRNGTPTNSTTTPVQPTIATPHAPFNPELPDPTDFL